MELNHIPVVHINKHPVLLDHDTQVVLEALPGESLYAFLARNNVETDGMQISVDGRIVNYLDCQNILVTHEQEIVLRSTVHRAGLYIVAMAAMLYFTGGAAAAVMSGGSFGGIVSAGAIAGMSTAASMAAIGAVQIVGAMLINKVLGPKVPSAPNIERGSVYNITAARNAARQWEPAGILFGSVQVTPDFAAQAWNYYANNDQYMQMLLTPGVNVARFDTLYLGDTPVSNYPGVTVKKKGFSAMADDQITDVTNADTIAGGTLDPNVYITRTTPLGVTRIQVAISYLLFDLTSKGKKKDNQETVRVEISPAGLNQWQIVGNHLQRNREQTEQRRSYFYDVAEGQYDVRVKRLGQDTDGSGATCEFTLVSITAYQAQQNNFNGVSVIQLDMKATGTLNGTPDEVRAVMYAKPLELWTGTQWQTVTEPGAFGTSNPGAQALQYARGVYENGERIWGMGLDDDMIDIEAFKALMVHCSENNIQYNMWVQDARNHKEFLDAIMYPAMGRVSMAPGKLTPLWAREEQGTSGNVNMATIKKGQFQVNYTLVSAADGVEFTYRDRATWETKTLRVPLPGKTVDEMVNPATISSEGIIDEEQAAIMARYHLAQTLYQAKDITYSTNMQFMGYQEMDLLDLQHDLTQWGYGGRIVEISRTNNVVTLVLDDVVPGRDNANAWIGLTVPGESSYRVFRVVPFVGDSDTLTLADPWPNDAPFPVNEGTKAQHDVTWIYDFKQTPGKRVRVVGMTPDDEFKGASVSVVPEDAEFWVYVKTGEYVPPNNDSQLNLKPIASNLSVSENIVEQGDTVFTELQALWDITNNSALNVVTCALDGEEPKVVAETTGLSASWRIEKEGTYIITVRPYAQNSTPGVATTVVYNTANTNLPPVNVDTFLVKDIGSGIRKYTWGWLDTTIQSPDTAGVEIRYVAGAVSSPFWDDMTPIGDDGFFTSSFESAVPVAGQWTFAIRARNTSGVLSNNVLIATYTLESSITEIVDRVQIELTQEIIDRFNGDAAAVLEAVQQASQYTDTQVAALNGILEDIVGADEWNATDTYPAGDFVRHNDAMYRALSENTNVEPGTDGGVTWQLIGDYTSVGDALAAAISMATTNASDIAVQAQRVDGVVARMPAGNGAVASEATVSGLQQALIDEATTRAQQIDAVNASLADKASAGAVSLLEGRVDVVEGAVTSQGQAITKVNAALTIPYVNRLPNPSFLNNSTDGWVGSAGALAIVSSPRVGALHIAAVAGPGHRFLASRLTKDTTNLSNVANPGEVSTFSATVNCDGSWYLEIQYYNDAGVSIGVTSGAVQSPTGGQWKRASVTSNPAPVGTTWIAVVLWADNSVSDHRLALPMLTLGDVAVPFIDSKSPVTQAQALTTQTAKVTALEAGAVVTNAAIAKMGGGGNLLQTTVFGLGLGLAPWFDRGGVGTWVVNDTQFQNDPNRVPVGMKALCFFADANQPINSYRFYAQSVPAEIGKAYIASAYFLPYQSRVGLEALFVDAGGTALGVYYSEATEAYTPNGNISGYTRLYVKTPPAPAGTATVWISLTVIKRTPVGGDAAAWVLQPMIEEVPTTQTQPSPWVSGANPATTASAITTLSVNINAVTGKVNAINGVYLDVNGYVSGTVSENNGVRSSFTILASLFRVVDPAGGARTEFSDGNWRVYHDNGTLIVRLGKWT